jgi:hypothetical protein
VKKLTLCLLLFIFCFGIVGTASAQIYGDKAPKVQAPPDAKAQQKMARKQAKKAAKAQKKLAKQTRKAQKKAARQYKNKHPEAS